MEIEKHSLSGCGLKSITIPTILGNSITPYTALYGSPMYVH